MALKTSRIGPYAWREAVMPPVAHTPILSGDLGGDAPLIGAAENVVSSAYASL